MTLGKEVLIISPGDYVFIPRNTYHSVLVKQGVLKVLSIQSPHFDGADRVWEK
jgi:mannose-6-phosphate isomerase-like protein (cupin superfamily)